MAGVVSENSDTGVGSYDDRRVGRKLKATNKIRPLRNIR